MERDNYLLIANHLRDIHHALEEKIVNSRTHSPKWEVQVVSAEQRVVELSSLLGIAMLLEKLAGSTEQQSFNIMSSGEDG